ncbi:MAG: serine/threonine protein kinase [Myxococcales bacterium]|nr:serine/threonine protein kinase [Myxococcales bacterium]
MATGIRADYPQQFGRYYLTQKIAMGGMAEIFRAKSVGAEGFEKVVVIKRILPHFSEDESFVTMFQDEARVAAHLNHANVVQIFDFDEVENLYYIAMEYVEGQDLKRVLDVGTKVGEPLSIAQAVFIMIEAGQGLDYAHKREVDGKPLNIIHRDISPHNMMVSYNGEVKIMDFGIAKAASRSTKTRVGTVKGKCAYMSPEQARGKPLDGRSDLFALGVCLWEMLSGKRLFVGDSDFETLNNVLRAEVPSLTEMNPEVPKELDEIVLKSLAKDRDERHKDVAAFVGDLRRWFYSTVPDPSAISLKGYLHGLFNDQISQLKADVAEEAQKLKDMRTNSRMRRPATNSRPVAAADDEATVALDTSGGIPGSDSEATVALDASAAIAMANRTNAPKKSNTGLFIGLGVLLVGIAGAGAFVGMGGLDKPKPVVVAPAPVDKPEPPPKKKIKIHISAPGAEEIKIDGETEATSDKLTFTLEEGRSIKILAIGKKGVKKLVRHTADKDGAKVSIKLPEVKADKPVAPVKVVADTIVLVQVEPIAAKVKINGSDVTLVNGNLKVPNLKLGDSFKIDVTADGFKPLSKSYFVKNKLETFEIKLEKERIAPKVVKKGKVTINARPWAKVALKGRKLGLTPRSISLPPGRHTFVLTKSSITKRITVDVKSGRTISKTIQMK